jgi:hypothetical protein
VKVVVWVVIPTGHGRPAQRIEAASMDITPTGVLIFKDAPGGNFIAAYGVGGWVSVQPITTL